MTFDELGSVLMSEERIRHLTGYGGRAKFIDKELVDVIWTPSGTTCPALTLGAGWAKEFGLLMRFLRVVEKAQLEIQYRCHILASNSGCGETQIWFQKPEDENLEEDVGIGAHIYEDRFGIEPNVLILNDKDESDVRFWKGKIRRVHWLLPTHFRLTYQAKDAKETE